MPNTKKFLDAAGVTYLASLLDNYPNNEILGTVIDAIQDALDEKASTALATTETAGLLSPSEKVTLNSLNPNILTTLSNINLSEFSIVNAKLGEDIVGMTIAADPIVSARIRTSNLLNIDNFTPGYYIGSNGQLATNANDHVGDFIPVTPGDVIYYTGHIGPTNSSSINRRLHVYDSNQTWIKQLSFAGSLKVGDDWSTHGTVPSNGAYVRVSWGVEDINVMVSVGAPSQYQPYYLTPFSPITSVTYKIGPTSDPSDATTYTFNVPAAAGNQYGFTFDPIQGKLFSQTAHIASYNGETLPGRWLSDRDVYVENTTPSIGAEVIYVLDDNDVTEYSFSPITITFTSQINYFFINNGSLLELKYYAQTMFVNHLTAQAGLTIGTQDVIEADIQNWNNALDTLDQKADLHSPDLQGAPLTTNPSRATSSRRIASTYFVHMLFDNVAPVESRAVSSKNYNAGEYLMVNGFLYKTLTNISSSTTLTEGVNIERTDVATELTTLFNLVQGGN